MKLAHCSDSSVANKVKYGIVGGVGSVAERRPLAGGLSLLHARPAANG